jgi:Flp pilus assembly protein TadD
VTDYRTALTMDPFLLPVRFNLAGMLNALGRNSDAEQVLRDGLERHPGDADLLYAAAVFYVQQGRAEEAQIYVELLAQQDSESPKFRRW